MTHYAVELAMWTLAAYFAGCAMGAVLRGVLSR
jgi:hypothetical protein